MDRAPRTSGARPALFLALALALAPTRILAAGSGSLPPSTSTPARTTPARTTPTRAPATRAPAPSPTSRATPARPAARPASSSGSASSSPASAPASRTPPAGTAGVRAAGAASVPELVRVLYDGGCKHSADADAAAARATATRDPQARAALEAQAHTGWERAASAFDMVLESQPRLHQAWNQLGYARRRLGQLPAALQAYGMALRLQPGYPPAVEYKAEADLALGHYREVKRAYMDLFRTERALADQLMVAMLAHTGDLVAAGDPEAVGFPEWVEARRKLAAQTADHPQGSGEGW